jgi:uncharacterized membrane protein
MALPAFLTSPIDSWAALYDAHRMLSVTVRYLHLAGLVVGGGTALVADRRILRAVGSPPAERPATIAAIRASHRVVVSALAVVVVTGVLMAASDVSTFLGSRLFWFKMGLVALLLLNGGGLLLAERAASRGRGHGWPSLVFTSAASLALWLAILFMGVWLTAAA